MQFVQNSGKNSFYYIVIFELFSLLEKQTFEFQHHDNGRVFKTVLSVAAGTFGGK